jgi:hypothetical protein
MTIWNYINTIRNKEKRNYARAYLFWLQNGAYGPAPEGGCSVMAQQAVRMNIDAYRRVA